MLKQLSSTVGSTFVGLAFARTPPHLLLATAIAFGALGCSSGGSALGGPSIADFQILSHRSEWDGGTFYVIGELKNAGTTAAGAEIEAIARDAGGVLVGSKQFWPNSIKNIPPGGTVGIKYHITDNRAAVAMEVKVVQAKIW